MNEPNYFVALHDPRSVLRALRQPPEIVREPTAPAAAPAPAPRRFVRSPPTEDDQRVLALFDTRPTLNKRVVAQALGISEPEAAKALDRIGARGLASMEPHLYGSNSPGVWRRCG